MTENKRFVDNGFEAIEEQSFTDNQTGKTYYVDYFDEIVDLLNDLSDENEQLKQSNSQLAKVNREGVKKVQKLAEENEILKKTYDVTENVNTALSEENEELHLLHGELIDKNNSLHKDVSSLVDEIVNLNSKIEHLEMENLQFKKVFNEIIKQVNVDLDPTHSRYAAVIVFSVQEFEFIRKMMKEGLK